MKWLLTLIFSLFFSVFSLAQKFSFIQYNTKKGLPQSQVNTITQDNDGYLWIGTYGGLARFDGEDFKNFGRNNGLLNNRITKLDVINNRLYIGHPQGVSFKNKNNSFTAIAHTNDTVFNDVSGFAALDSTIYVATNGGGLYFIDQQKSLAPVPESPERIRAIVEYKNTLYLATRTGIHIFDGQNFKVIKNTNTISFSGIELKNNEIYVSAFNGVLYKLNHQNLTIKEQLSHDVFMFRNINIDHKNNLWLNTGDGILLVKENDTIELTEKLGLPTNDIYAVFEDSENNIWIGTNGKGIIRFTDEVFTYYNESSGLPSDIIIAMEKDLLRGKFRRQGGKQLPAGNYIQAKAFLFDQAAKGFAQKGFPGITDPRLRVYFRQSSLVISAVLPNPVFIHYIKRRFKPPGQFNRVTTGDLQVPPVVDPEMLRDSH